MNLIKIALNQKKYGHIIMTQNDFFIAKFKKIDKIDTDFKKEYFPKKSQQKALKSKESKILYSQIKKRFNIDKTVFETLSIIKKENSLTIRTNESNSFANFPNIHNM
jgi:D-ribose pyranose/furanose isomerase RbsD